MAIVRPKEAYHQRTSEQMERFFRVPDWTVQQKMALACRFLADKGHESGLAGQITARGEKPGTYWMLSFGLGFDEAQAGNIVLCDDDLNLLEGDGMVNPSNRFHLWIYPHRPQVNAIIHNALGENRSILLAHHGQLCACATLEQAAVLSVFIERAARMQLMARAVGEIRRLGAAEAKEAHDYRLKPKAIGATFFYFARRVLRKGSEVLE